MELLCFYPTMTSLVVSAGNACHISFRPLYRGKISLLKETYFEHLYTYFNLPQTIRTSFMHFSNVQFNQFTLTGNCAQELSGSYPRFQVHVAMSIARLVQFLSLVPITTTKTRCLQQNALCSIICQRLCVLPRRVNTLSSW